MEGYIKFERNDWQNLASKVDLPLSKQQLKVIKAFNDQISLDDVQSMYVPLVSLIKAKYHEFERWNQEKLGFLKLPVQKVPFIIGISGSVAVGKSTTARLLQVLLSHWVKDTKVQLITTDGFLYNNATLEKKEILDRKGFPESYDMVRLIEFLSQVKDGISNIKVPKYSHQSYDILDDEFDIIDQPDILIVEGINVLQLPVNQSIYVSDFFDWSIYVDANSKLIEHWFLERFQSLLEIAKQDKTNYYYQYAMQPLEKSIQFAKQVWRDIDLVNLNDYILPTRNRADVIMHKTKHHLMDKVYVKK